MSAVVVMEKVSCRFDIYQRPADLLYELLWKRPRHDVVWALRDITFSLKKGQRLGVIGPNGSGKSTLLKTIVGHIPPTSGRVIVDGKVSAILSQTWVFNSELSGIENVRFNLHVNGCPKTLLNDVMDDVIQFAELGPFIYHPVKTYSAGMNARLAFAISTAIQPEILVLDEVLGVGDAYFMGKAMKRMTELCDRGKALIYVSHDLASVQRLCDVILWLDQGVLREFGPARIILQKYEADYRSREDHLTRAAHAGREGKMREDTFALPELHRFRLVPSGAGEDIADTFFVRRIAMCSLNGDKSVINVGVDDVFSPEKDCGLEVRGCEWGRSYERAGIPCRLLFGQAGYRRGGEFVLRREVDQDQAISITWETTAMKQTQSLTLEYLDLAEGRWVLAAEAQRVALPDGWERASTTVTVRHLDELTFRDGLRRLRERERPEVEIEDAALIVEGQSVDTVKEHQGFDILVRIRAHKPAACISVGIKILRSDGTYVFWQPSGWNDNNLTDLEGEAAVIFHFRENCFSAGEYVVSTYCSNGWDHQRNYPYSEVFDRKVGILSFSIEREFSAIDFGQVNMRVPISYQRGQP